MNIVELTYPVSGCVLPADNGYPLYSAVSRHLGQHLRHEVSLASIGGDRCALGRIMINRGSCLRLRTPCEMIRELLPLAGATLSVDGDEIVLGVPHVESLKLSATLVSRLVAIKGYTEPEPFLVAAEQKLRSVCQSGQLSLRMLTRGPRSGSPQRRVVRIKGKVIVGFGLQVRSLRAKDSESLLIHGLGGRRHMGCGIFVPVREWEEHQ